MKTSEKISKAEMIRRVLAKQGMGGSTMDVQMTVVQEYGVKVTRSDVGQAKAQMRDKIKQGIVKIPNEELLGVACPNQPVPEKAASRQIDDVEALFLIKELVERLGGSNRLVMLLDTYQRLKGE